MAFAFDGSVTPDTTGADVRQSIATNAFAPLARHFAAALEKAERVAADSKGVIRPALEARIYTRQRN